MPKDLEASIDIAAPPERVWAVVSDLERMPEWSPQCAWTKVIGPARAGAWSVNLNRDGWKHWPTTARIVRYQPGKSIAFRINENKMTWSFDLEPTANGTRLVQSRDASRGSTWISRTLIDTAMGGERRFEPALVEGMQQTLARIKAAVEGAVKKRS